MNRTASDFFRATGFIVALGMTMFACANGAGIFDGGAGGTGIGSATIQGNVMMDGSSSPANVRVHARGTTVEALTDGNGFFELVGIDAGGVTLEFRRTSNRQPATVDVFAASGSIVTLTDVHFVGGAAEAVKIDLSNIVGNLVAAADCDGPTGALDVDDGEGTFAVVIDDATVVSGPGGVAATCTDLKAGAQVKLRGRQNGLEIVATEVRILR